MHDWVQKLKNGKYILASWVPCACEWYAVGVWHANGNPVTAGTVDGLGTKRKVKKYTTAEEAQRALGGGGLITKAERNDAMHRAKCAPTVRGVVASAVLQRLDMVNELARARAVGLARDGTRVRPHELRKSGVPQEFLWLPK